MKKSRKKNAPKRVLRLPDLDYAKGAVLNTLGSPESKRAYEFAIDDFVTWYCSEPRLAFNKTVVLRSHCPICREHVWRFVHRGSDSLFAAKVSLGRSGAVEPPLLQQWMGR